MFFSAGHWKTPTNKKKKTIRITKQHEFFEGADLRRGAPNSELT